MIAELPKKSGSTHPAVLAGSSALALFLAFPPANQGFLAWFALTPFFLLVEDNRKPWSIYLGALVGGFVFWGFALFWVATVHIGGYLIMSSFLALSWPLFLFLARLAVRKLRLPMMMGVPITWVAVEYARVFVLSGFPWFYLAHTQYLYPVVIQICDLGGAWGLSFVMAMVNAAWVDLLQRPLFAQTSKGSKFALAMKLRLGTLLIAVGFVLLYGGWRLTKSKFRPGPRLALLQTDFKQVLGNPPPRDTVLLKLNELVTRVSTAPLSAHGSTDWAPPDLVVWPESSYPDGILRIDPRMEPKELEKQITQLGSHASIADIQESRQQDELLLRGWVERSGIPFVIGTMTYDFNRAGLLRYNSAILIAPGRPEWVSYHKQLLVPFGEYIPLLKLVPALLWLTPFHDGYVPGMAAGPSQKWFDREGVRYAPLICFEDSSPDLARRAFLGEAKSHPPDVLLNMTNDGWFRGTAEHQTHLAVSVFRAVECRAPMARAVNTGISALIDGNGTIRAQLPQEKAASLVVDVPLDDRTSLYIAAGDWLPLCCAAVTLGLLPLAWVRGRKTAVGGTEIVDGNL